MSVRVALFTSEEPLYLPRYLEPILAAHADRIDAVVLAPPDRPLHEQVRRQYRMFGPRAFPRMGALFARGRLLDSLPGGLTVRLTGRHHSVASVARAHDVPVRRAPDVTDGAFVEWVRDQNPDVLLSVVCGQLLGSDLLSVPEHAVNLHGSLLPAYRGRAVAFWPLYHGEDETGVTAHRMTTEWDAGPILDQRRVPIDADETYHSLSLKLAETGSGLAVDLLDRLASGDVPAARPNQTTPEDYHTLPTPAERRAFRRRENRFL